MSLRILNTFPLFSDALPAEQSYDSFDVPGVDFYCIADNPKPEIEALIKRRELPIKIRNKTDQFATGCWNQTVEYFLKHPEYDCLRLGFTDVVMHKNWKEILEKNWDEDQAIMPNFTDSLARLHTSPSDIVEGQKSVKDGGTPADCVFLSRKLVELVFPVPEAIKLWYNDEYIFSIMRELGYETVVLENLYAFHYGSIILTGTYGAESSARIDIDQYNWKHFVKEDMMKTIERLKANGRAKA